MQFASLGSGSKGNATVVQSFDACVLIDNGFSIRETIKRLERLELTAADLDAVLLTHEHSDHSSGVSRFCRRFEIPLYSTFGSSQKLDLKGVDLRVIKGEQSFSIKDLNVQPTVVPHDAREPVQFVLRSGQSCLGVLTDLGCITPHVIERYKVCDALIVECNHDLLMLEGGPYPFKLKERVASDWGHLSNAQTAQLLRKVNVEDLQHLVVAHISEKNNSLESVKIMLAEFGAQLQNLVIANQKEGFSWLKLS